MREVSCFLSPALYQANHPAFIEGLRQNDIEVQCLDVSQHPHTGYSEQVREHNRRLAEREGCFCQQLQSHQEAHHHAPPVPEDYHFLCIAFEDSGRGVRAARSAGMCVVGIGSNHIECDRLKGHGAHAVATSVSELLENFHVRNYYQVQYLPYAIYLRDIVEKKVGYPVSLLDTLYGRFVKSEHGRNTSYIEEDDDSEDDEKKDDEDSSNRNGTEQTSHVDLNHHANRLIPRDVLGIEPGSLADVYINNVGWPADKVPNIHFNARGLEMDVIRIFGKYYRVPNGTMRGFVTSGGTEGNFTGLWWQRDYLKRLSNGLRPILLASNQTHYSIAKAAQQLDIDSHTTSTMGTGEIDCNELALALDNIADSACQVRPVLMVVNAGTTQTGAIDNLPKIHQLLIDKISSRGGHFSIHMDAALMGAVLPIINPFGEAVDYFSDLGVETMAISGHKFFGSVVICGLLLTTASFLNDCFRPEDTNVDYVTGLHDITPSGSRNGFSVLSFHNTVCGLYMHTDCRRLKVIVHQCYRNAHIFVERMSALVGPENVIRPPHSLQVCFPRPSQTMMIKYSLMPVNLPSGKATANVPLAGVCILINVDFRQINSFMEDYKCDPEAQKYLL